MTLPEFCQQFNIAKIMAVLLVTLRVSRCRYAFILSTGLITAAEKSLDTTWWQAGWLLSKCRTASALVWRSSDEARRQEKIYLHRLFNDNGYPLTNQHGDLCPTSREYQNWKLNTFPGAAKTSSLLGTDHSGCPSLLLCVKSSSYC